MIQHQAKTEREMSNEQRAARRYEHLLAVQSRSSALAASHLPSLSQRAGDLMPAARRSVRRDWKTTTATPAAHSMIDEQRQRRGVEQASGARTEQDLTDAAMAERAHHEHACGDFGRALRQDVGGMIG